MKNKKLIILYIYDLLKMASKNNNYLLQKDISDGINNVFNVECSLRTVNRNIKYLIDYGCKIEYVQKKGYILKEKANIFKILN